MASGMVFMFICYLIGIYNLVQGDVNLSRQEELELEKQLKLLNKPSVKTIKTDYGELYDCVDFYKQPTFDLPSQKNHSYHFNMKPQFQVVNKDQTEAQAKFGNSFGLRDGGCPVGTVPIRRTTKEDLIRQKFASKDSSTRLKLVAVGHSPQSYKFRGALGVLSIYNPQVNAKQYSVARIVVQNDDESIEYGWRVDPYLYGDYATHFYIHTNTSSANCYDAKCGFVVTSLDTSPGLVYSDVSTIGGDRYEMKPRVQRDNGGNWWLSIDNYNRHIGFWPHSLFTKLNDNATYVEWGGEVYTPDYIPGPLMGSGVKPDNNSNIKATTAYFRWIAGIDLNGSDFNPPIVKVTNDKDGHYDVIEVDSPNPDWGHHIFFGGKRDI